MLGVSLMLVAVFLVARAGKERDKERQAEANAPSGSFGLGVLMAVAAGVLQVGLSLAFVYTQGPVMDALAGAPDYAANATVWAATLPGGAAVNIVYALWLARRRRTLPTLWRAPLDLGLGIAMGLGFFLMVLLLGHGMRAMGAMGASLGFGLYQGVQIVAFQSVGVLGGEWRGVASKPRRQMLAALAMILLAIVVMSLGKELGQS